MTDEGKTLNELFANDETIELEQQIWGKNPSRSRALQSLWFDLMCESIDEEDMPEKGKRELLFLMAVNNAMDMIMEAIPDEMALELTYCFDSMIGMSLVNKRFSVDLLDNNYNVISKLKREDYESDEAFQEAVQDIDHRWWTIGKQLLGGRSPNDAITEELGKFGLNK